MSLLGTSNQQLQGEEEEEDDDDEVEEVQPRRAKLTAFKDCSLVNGRSLGPDLVGGLEHFLFSHILGIIIPTD